MRPLVRRSEEPALTCPRVSVFMGHLIPQAGLVPVDHTGRAAPSLCHSWWPGQQPETPEPRKGEQLSLQKPLPRGAVGGRPLPQGAQQEGTSPRGSMQNQDRQQRPGQQARARVHSSHPFPSPSPLQTSVLSTSLPRGSWDRHQGLGGGRVDGDHRNSHRQQSQGSSTTGLNVPKGRGPLRPHSPRIAQEYNRQ